MFASEWALGSANATEALAVRRVVFVEELKWPEEKVFDARDTYAAHLMIRLEEEPIASGRMYHVEDGVCLDMLCVLQTHRGERFFDLMVRLMLAKAQDMGTPRVHVWAAQAHMAYFTAFGFGADDTQTEDHLHLSLDPQQVDWHPACG